MTLVLYDTLQYRWRIWTPLSQACSKNSLPTLLNVIVPPFALYNTYLRKMKNKEEHTDGKHPNSAIEEHTPSTSHHYTLDDTKTLVKEDKWFQRKIRETLHIHILPST